MGARYIFWLGLIFAVSMAATAVLAGCGDDKPAQRGSDPRPAREEVPDFLRKTPPDENGIVCYYSSTNSTALQCVKVAP